MSHIPPGTADSVSALLGELSQSDLTQLMKILDGVAAADPRAVELSRILSDAVAAQDPGRAIEAFRQLAHLDPERAEALLSAPGIASMRPVLESLMNHLTAAGKLHAESRLFEATGKLDSATFKDGVKPEVFVTLATGLMDAGGLANYSRSAAISEALLAQALTSQSSVDAGRRIPASQTGLTTRSPFTRPRRIFGIWLGVGVLSILWCWWFRGDLLPIVSAVWVGGGIVLLLAKSLLIKK